MASPGKAAAIRARMRFLHFAVGNRNDVVRIGLGFDDQPFARIEMSESRGSGLGCHLLSQGEAIPKISGGMRCHSQFLRYKC